MDTISDTDTEFVTTRLAHCFAEGDHVGDSSITLDSTVTKLEALPSETREYLAHILRNEKFDSDSDYALDRLLIFMLHHNASILDIEDVACIMFTDEAILEQSIDYFDWEEGDTIPSYFLKEMLLGLRSYTDIEGFPYDKTTPIRRQGEKVIEQSMALLTMAVHLERVNEYQFVDGVTVIPDNDIVELVAAFPDRFVEIANMMDDRDYEHIIGIREVLSGEVHIALADGVI